MSRDNKRKYLSAYIPEVTPKETPKRDGRKSDGRYAEIEAAVAALSDMMAKQNRDNLDAMYNIDMDNMSSSMRRLFQSYDDGITKAQASIESWANAQEAGFKAIAKWIGTDADGNLISSAAEIKSTVSGNKASIDTLAKLVDADSKALAGFKSEVSKTYATTQQFSSFQTTVNNTITNSYAGFVTQADEKYAKAEQIASVTDKDGNVTAAAIVAEVNGADSSVLIDADRLNLNGDVYISGKDDEEEVMRILGNKLQLLHRSNADESAASIAFWYKEFDNELLGTFGTTRNTKNDDDARYAVTLETFNRGGDFPVALKFISEGASSLESGSSVYMKANTYFNIHAEYGTRIYAAIPFAAAIDYTPEPESYLFCTEGIYWVDWTGEVHPIVVNP